MKPKTINLHIDKIALEGVGSVNRGQLALSLQNELHRLIDSQGLHGSLNQPTSINHVNAKPISIGSRVREKQLGHQIAHSVYRGMKR
jgi:hypothetical protein